ncbi:DNA-binding transcriptional LysR family regulator [Geomicrobium halophilum]|uniref:DNA-binding transcriptional LysR family regulator n=1 Tax=Geomicrobium halophilum TaxID=549000 RepID=A0A841Q2N8_9BACL|nr:LysR family transcriptional regulator [Geomicrobium halophilum]MBB6450958.1 DNA-binding transcriptional LysR family regulator [Geomicrobium halophilum]
MEIKQLRFFLEVYKQKSFSKASETLHISQPTLSKVIHQLEEELGIRLFDRSTRHLQVTEEGEMMRTHAHKVMREVEDMQKAANDIRLRKKGSFHFGLPPVIGSSFFPNVIADFIKRYPEVDMHIVEEGAKVMEQSLLEGNIDVGVGILPVDHEQFEVLPIVEKKLQLVVSSSHALAKRERVEMRELKNEHFLLFLKGFSLYDRVRDACIQAGFEPNIINESTQWDFLIKMAKENLGITFLPETVFAEADLSGTSVIDIENPQILWSLAIIWRKDSYQSHAAKEWVQFVKKTFADQGPTWAPNKT